MGILHLYSPWSLEKTSTDVIKRLTFKKSASLGLCGCGLIGFDWVRRGNLNNLTTKQTEHWQKRQWHSVNHTETGSPLIHETLICSIITIKEWNPFRNSDFNSIIAAHVATVYHIYEMLYRWGVLLQDAWFYIMVSCFILTLNINRRVFL